MGSIMGSQNIMDSDYGSNISDFNPILILTYSISIYFLTYVGHKQWMWIWFLSGVRELRDNFKPQFAFRRGLVVQRADCHADGPVFEPRTADTPLLLKALQQRRVSLLFLFLKNFTVYPLRSCAKHMQRVKQKKKKSSSETVVISG